MKKAWPSSAVPRRPLPRRAFAASLLATVLALPGLTPGAATSRSPARSGGTYLPTLGPAPLRILPVKPFLAPVVLPPLSMKDPVVLPGTTDTNTPAPGTNVLGVPSSPPHPGPEPGGTPGSVPILAGESATESVPAPIYTPQMLVQFFRPAGSNLVGGVWNVPTFVPPSVTPSKSSSATYRSP